MGEKIVTMTTIYLIRHSESLKENYECSNDSFQVHNEKQVLSVEGERKAKVLSEIDKLSNVDEVISSNYVRAISTAKYIAKKNNKDIDIIDDFGERKFGVDSYDELPSNFGILQLNDENYKMPNGESQKEVRERMLYALNNVLIKYKDKRVVIVSHGTAMVYLFKTWCDIKLNSDNTYSMCFNNKLIFNGKHFNEPEIFKLEFDDNKLMNIENINIKF